MRLMPQTLRQAVKFVLIANLGYFFVEIFVALGIGSVSLFADSVDFLEDAAINLLILLALAWSPKARARIGMLLALIILVPALATAFMAWEKFQTLSPPQPFVLGLTGLGALAVNMICAFVLMRFRHHSGSMTKAAFLSARNDSIANLAIIVAGLLTAALHSGWPDLIVGIGIGLMNIEAAFEVWQAARKEKLEIES